MSEVVLRGMVFKKKNEYGLFQHARRMQHDVNEGDMVTLFHRSDVEDKGRIVNVKVVSVDYYHITVRFPAGYNKSLTWNQFDAERQ